VKKVFGGIDLGGTTIDIGLVSAHGEILCTSKIPSNVSNGPDHTIDRIADAVIACASEYGESDVGAIGIGIAGLVDNQNGILREATNLPGWTNVRLADRLQEKLGLPVKVDNDANVAALGEYAFGAGRGYPHMMMVTLGTGVGAGLILDGQIFHGAHQAAGEFGHITIDHHGPLCGCGAPGCVEAYVGTQGILRQVRELLPRFPDSPLGDINEHVLTPKDIYNKAELNDALALQVFADAGQALGFGLVSVVNLLNIQRVVLGGGVAAAGDFLIKSAQNILDEFSLNNSDEPVQIVRAQFGEYAGIIGAASLAMTGV
jgi:glucokinase